VLICKLDIPLSDAHLMKPGSCMRWNYLFFCGLQEPQRGFCDLGLQWGCALGRMYQRSQHWVADLLTPKKRKKKGANAILSLVVCACSFVCDFVTMFVCCVLQKELIKKRGEQKRAAPTLVVPNQDRQPRTPSPRDESKPLMRPGQTVTKVVSPYSQ